MNAEQLIRKLKESNLIPADSLNYLLKDDLPNFMKTRKEALLNGLRERLGGNQTL